MSILTSKVATIKLGSVEIEGLLLEDGTFGVAQQQIATLFQLLPTSAPKWLKSILGKDASLFSVKTNREEVEGVRSRSTEKAVSIDQFREIVVRSATKGHPTGITLRDALIGLSLHQLFSDSFGIKFEKEDRD